MQSQSWHQKEKYEDDAQLDEEQQQRVAQDALVFQNRSVAAK